MKMRRYLFLWILFVCMTLQAKTFPFGKGQLSIKTIAPNAVRIQYSESVADQGLPDWLYVKQDEVAGDLSVDVDNKKNTVTVKDKNGRKVFVATGHQLRQGQATLTIASPKDEYLYGLGQFQDGYSNIRGLPRRLTQVNTQISIPMMISSKGYGLLWNNYGLTEFNPSSQSVTLSRANSQQAANSQVVNVTSTEGSKQEVREQHIYEATLTVKEEGDYALLLDVGQKMARRHHLTIDGQTVIEMQNLWLPPTASAIVHLKKGKHQLKAELSRGDQPVVFYHPVKDETVFQSPIASCVDYTVFTGSPDEIIATYRELTGAEYNALLNDCIKLRKEKHLCDWAYYKMLQSLAEAACGKGTNEAVFLQGVLFSQSGYQMRFAFDSSRKLHLLSRINGFAFNYNYLLSDGKIFFLLDGCKEKSLNICEARFDKEQEMDLDHSMLPDLRKDMSTDRRVVSNFVKLSAQTSVNKNMINFFNDYPISNPPQGKDVTLKWYKYGNLPLTQELKDKLYPQLKAKISTLPKTTAVNMLLSWIQYGIEYMLDEKVWGHDRPFFAEETLYYPYADCEDRAVLLSQLVRDLLDLDVVLVYNANPGHLYTAINFKENVPGDYIMVDGRKFTVADPTYYGAGIGKTMNRMNNATAKVLLLNKQ